MEVVTIGEVRALQSLDATNKVDDASIQYERRTKKEKRVQEDFS